MKLAIWIGPVVDDFELINSKASSPAANLWQSEFIGALEANSYSVTCFTYLPFQSWPIGKLWVRRPSTTRFRSVTTGYLNLPFIREWWISISLFVKIALSCPDRKANLMFTYNPLLRHHLLARWTSLCFGTKWVSIVADRVSKGKPDIHLFLSYGYFERFKKENKRFLDGGVVVRNVPSARKTSKERILLYAGSTSKYTGIESFATLFIELGEKLPLELHIYGSGHSEHLMSLAAKSTKIRVFGYVDNTIVQDACLAAYAFVNPRPENIPLVENNFPSKLLFYLSYFRPVLSTKTGGISPAYDQILEYFNDATSFYKKMERLLDDSEYYSEKCALISEFAKFNTWEIKVAKLLKSL